MLALCTVNLRQGNESVRAWNCKKKEKTKLFANIKKEVSTFSKSFRKCLTHTHSMHGRLLPTPMNWIVRFCFATQNRYIILVEPVHRYNSMLVNNRSLRPIKYIL